MKNKDMYNLTQKDSFLRRFEQSVKECWNKTALVEFNQEGITYGELAAELEKTVLWWRAAGLLPGDKVAINARSSANWAKTFFAAQTGGFVAVQLFNGFTPADTMHLVDHSDSRILYTEKAIFEKMDFEAMPKLLGVIDTKSGELLAARGDFAKVYESREAGFTAAHPAGLRRKDVHYPDRPLDELCALMYTSGSTGNPKGVMISVRNFSSNIQLIPIHFPYKRDDNYVSVLPYAHIFGLVYDLMAPLCYGMTLCILYVPPVPAYLKPALRAYKPYVFFAVPLIINKMIDDTIGEFIHSKSGAAKLADYRNNPDFCEALRTIFMNAFGGRLGLMITGGAAMPEQLERLFLEQLKVPFVTGYGMTECTPTITLGHKEAKSEILSQYETAAKQADTRKNSEFVMPMISHFFDNQAFMDPQMEYQVVQAVLQQLSAPVINQLAQQIITRENMVVIYQAPEKEGLTHPTAEQIKAIIDQVENAQLEQAAGEDIPEAFLNPATLKGSKASKAKPYAHGAQTFKLRNGVNVYLLPTDYEKDRITEK